MLKQNNLNPYSYSVKRKQNIPVHTDYSFEKFLFICPLHPRDHIRKTFQDHIKNTVLEFVNLYRTIYAWQNHIRNFRTIHDYSRS